MLSIWPRVWTHPWGKDSNPSTQQFTPIDLNSCKTWLTLWQHQKAVIVQLTETLTVFNPSLVRCESHQNTPYLNLIEEPSPEFDWVHITLRVETDRWARIPHELRTCQCSTGIQDEKHVKSLSVIKYPYYVLMYVNTLYIYIHVYLYNVL